MKEEKAMHIHGTLIIDMGVCWGREGGGTSINSSYAMLHQKRVQIIISHNAIMSAVKLLILSDTMWLVVVGVFIPPSKHSSCCLAATAIGYE